jgi:hypothetical protein
VPQGKVGKCTKKGKIIPVLSLHILITLVDMLKVIAAALKAEQPTREDLENIINEVCIFFCPHICSTLLSSAHPNAT